LLNILLPDATHGIETILKITPKEFKCESLSINKKWSTRQLAG
jgi:hypothetical protein